MTSESDPKPSEMVATIKLDKSRPYVRARSTFPVGAGSEDLRPARWKLAQSLNEAWRAYQDSPDNGRGGVCIALAAALKFIEAADPQSAEIFERFHMVLIAALRDLDEGITSPLLKKGKGQGRETDSFAYKEIQRLAAATMAGLMDAGYPRNDAAKKVTGTLTKNGFRTATKRAVEKWYDEILPVEAKPRKGRPPKSTPGPKSEDARLHFVVNQARGTAKFLLNELTFFTRLWFPAQRKRGA